MGNAIYGASRYEGDMSILMSTDSQRVKLAALRARTDWQLVGLIHRELERGLDHARASSTGERDRAEQYRAKAERAYATAQRLLPAVDHLSQSERHHLEAKLRGLRALLDDRSASGGPKARTAGA
jgi:hypothetical protein